MKAARILFVALLLVLFSGKVRAENETTWSNPPLINYDELSKFEEERIKPRKRELHISPDHMSGKFIAGLNAHSLSFGYQNSVGRRFQFLLGEDQPDVSFRMRFPF